MVMKLPTAMQAVLEKRQKNLGATAAKMCDLLTTSPAPLGALAKALALDLEVAQKVAGALVSLGIVTASAVEQVGGKTAACYAVTTRGRRVVVNETGTGFVVAS